MKINDDQLMQKIWELQIKKSASGVLHRYFGGGHGLVVDSEFWEGASLDVHVSERHQITSKIGRQQLLKRIRNLIEQGRLMWIHEGRTFGVADKHMWLPLFHSARNAWQDIGLGCDSVVVIEGFEQKLDSVRKLLIDKHRYANGGYLKDAKSV
ncbi:hypothetical protein [Shewanella algae]|uniref:hypothetical protein n=1 Tax=Shewanella algae TaxID=38313 RepID=UPI0031F56F1C